MSLTQVLCRRSLFLGCLLSFFSTALAQNSKSLLVASGTADITKIQHVVFIIKENRSFDEYFGAFPGVDGATTGIISSGAVIPLGHTPDQTPTDIDHTWNAAVTAMDGPLSGPYKMDQYDLIFNGNHNGDFLAYTQMYQADIPNYYSYASNFVIADRMFSSIHANSFPNHLYTV